MNTTKLRSLGAVTAALLAACGGGSSGSPAPASAEALCQAYSTALITKVSACGLTPFPDVILGFYVSALFDCRTFQEAQDAGRVAFDQAKAKACLDDLGPMTCSQIQAGGIPFSPSCMAAVTPKVAPGGACFSRLGFECAGGWCDLPGVGATCVTGGVCQAFAALGESCATATCGPGLLCGAGFLCAAKPVTTLVGVGASCATSDKVCSDGLFCDGGTKICTARGVLGAACEGFDQCLEGLHCDPVSFTCAAWLKVGDTCVAGKGQCGGKAHCGSGGRCVASPVIGGDCSPVAGEQVYCQAGWCAPAVAPATTQACVPFAAPGATCDTGHLLQCGLSHTCNVVGAGTAGTCGRNYCGFM